MKALWQRLGFTEDHRPLYMELRPVPPQNPEFPELLYFEGDFRINMKNRIRLLISGKAKVALMARTREKIVDYIPAASLIMIAPGKGAKS